MPERGLAIHPFFKWLLGWSAIGLVAFTVMRAPGSVQDKAVVGLATFFFGGWMLVSLVPTRRTPWTPDVARVAGVMGLTAAVLLHRFRPDFLAGQWFGWASPLYPALLLLSAISSAFRLAGRW